MEHKGIDQTQMAGRLDCETGTISKLVSGKQRLSDPWMAGFAWALDIEVADLFRDPNQPTQEDLLRDLPPEKRDQIIKVIKALRDTG